MSKKCIKYSNFRCDEDTLFDKQFELLNNDEYMEDINDLAPVLNCSSDGNCWEEFSYHKYTDNILDYGVMSDWDLFLETDVHINKL